MKKKMSAIVSENLSYKLVALFVALILWLSILGRRDFVATKEVEVNFITAPPYSIVSQSSDRIRLKVSGSQNLLKKFREQNSAVNVDAIAFKAGTHDFDINLNMIEIPQGVRILSYKPSSIKVELAEKQ